MKMGLVDKLKDRLSTSSTSSDVSFPPAPPPIPLGANSVYRYRKQRGVNLGSWFVLEKWITGEPFQKAAPPAQSDLDIARGQGAKDTLEHHWDTFITEEDWKWIAEHGFNSARLPIGYYHLSGACPEVLKDTEFEPFSECFSGSWDRIKNAVATAGRHGLGILIDLHSAPGAQNADAHSGTSKGRAELFDRPANLRSTSLALRFLASQFASVPHVIGLELLNEPARGNMKLQAWYEKTIKEVQTVAGPHFPIYVHDSFDAPHYVGWNNHRRDFVVIDHHFYRLFGDPNENLDGEGQARQLRGDQAGNFAWLCEQARGNLVVGEWSGALKWENIKHLPDGERDRQHREFVRAELEMYERSSAGWFFWTLKKDGWDAGWSARDEVRAEILPNWVGGARFKGLPDESMCGQQLRAARGPDSHVGYWQSHNGSPHPEIFSSGFKMGWDDSLLFLSQAKSSEMGFILQWARRRMDENPDLQQIGKSVWEWEHGFEQGVKASKTTCMN